MAVETVNLKRWMNRCIFLKLVGKEPEDKVSLMMRRQCLGRLSDWQVDELPEPL